MGSGCTTPAATAASALKNIATVTDTAVAA
jgi:hypothetical protein